MLEMMMKFFDDLIFLSQKFAIHRKIKIKIWLSLMLGGCTLWVGGRH
jgi:hypothetical protein